MAKVQVMVYGAGGMGREVAWLLALCNQIEEAYEVLGFIDDDLQLTGTLLNGLPVVGWPEALKKYPNSQIVVALGSPRGRQAVTERVEKAGFACATMIAPGVQRSPWVEIGPGSVICLGSTLTTNIRLGKSVQVNLNCTINHDVLMGDYCTLAPGVHVSGWVHMGERVRVGTGAVFINGTREEPLVIGHDAVIGAGACVTRSVMAAVTVVGVPARPIQR